MWFISLVQGLRENPCDVVRTVKCFLFQQASQTANLLQAARATELLRQQVAAQQASLAAVQQQQLKLLQQQRKGEGEGEEERRDDATHN